MAVASNKVIEGEFKGKNLFCKKNRAYIVIKLPPSAPLFGTQKSVFLDSNTVASYRRVDSSSDVSLASAMVRGAVGEAVAGDIGGIAGAMTAGSYSSNIVLITFKDGKKSLINIDDRVYDSLKRGCSYNINFDDTPINQVDFNLFKEIKCPHCKNVAYGAVGERCPFCNREYNMPAKEFRAIDKITIPLLILFFPVGLIMMWVNKSFYLRTRVILSIVFLLLFTLVMYSGINNSKNINTGSNGDNLINIEEVI